MKKIAMRLLSMLIVLSMVLSAAPLTALATYEDTVSEAVSDSFDLSAIQNITLLKTDGVEVDKDDPAIIAVSTELDNMKVLGADGQPTTLTEEQKQQVLAMFQQYLDQWDANADVLGVQTPFFLQYNDTTDEYGILGEMLAMSNIPVDYVRAGYVSFDDLTGMIMNFYYGDQLGIQYYGSAIKNARDEVLDLIEESGALTDAQKYLVINNWLAQNVTFDMEYIMNADKDTNGDGVIDENDNNTDPMVAENPQEHEHYQDVYAVIYDAYEPQIEQMIYDQVYAGIEGDLRQKFYENVIRQMIYDGYLDGARASDDVKEGAKQMYYGEQYQAALAAEEQKVYDEAYAAYATHEHDLTVTFVWAEDYSSATATAVCETGLESYTASEVTVTSETTATCTEAGKTTYTATATFEVGTATDTKEVEVEALGHDFGSNGVCSRCKETTEDHEHSYTATVTKAPTCTEAGVNTLTCDCGESMTSPIEATGHEITSAVTTEPTCTTEGVTTFTCQNEGCDYSYTEAIAMVAHQVVDSVCTVCGATFSEEIGGETGEETETTNADGEVDPDADNYAKSVVESKKADIEAAATATADAALEAATDEDLAPYIEAIVVGDEETITDVEAAANDYADQFMEDNAEAIEAGARDFLVNMLTEQVGEEAAAQYMADIDAQCDGFIETAETTGIEAYPEEAPGVLFTIKDLADQTMSSDEAIFPVDDGTGNTVYITPAQAVEMGTQQAAAGLTDGILNYWQGSHFGALGRGNAVCLGYTKAFTYLVQCLKSDIYTTNGNINNAANWKTAEELYYTNGELDVTKNYAVDSVRISFDAQVTMFGETEDNFNSDHFWNAVQIDGQWFYIDPCYVDVYTEVMIRDRVETDGSVNHLYFLFSHGTAAELYDGNYSDIKTLYGTGTGMGTDLEASASPANSTAYEDSWFSRIKSNLYFDDGVAYYIYNSTDIVTLMDDVNNNTGSSDVSMSDFEVKLVGHTLDTTEANDQGDTDYTAYIEFNYFENEDDEESEARVRDADGNMVTNDMLTDLYADHQAAAEIYPSLAITCALYNNKLYFNLDTSLLCYDLKTCEVTRVKEYNTVYGVRDDTNPFGGMAFSTTNSADSADFTVYNHPIAAIALKDDGNLYVSIATNFAFISGKDNIDDTSSYGYEYEESNFNADYNSYTASQYEDNDMYESMGYEQEVNDNDEFMWSANFVETISMSELAGTNHDYEEVSVAATCRHNAFTENRCADCGAIEADTRVEEEGTAHAHHYIYFYETFYTKDDNGTKNADHCYVCTECGFAISEPTEPQENDQYGDYGTSYEEQMEIYEAELAIYNEAKETAGHTYVPTDATWAADNSSVTFRNLECSAVCPERKNTLDCLLVNDEYNDPISISLNSTITANASLIESIGTCPEGVIQIWDASGTATQNGKEYPYTLTRTVTLDKTDCKFEGGFCTVCGDCTVHRISGEDRITTSRAAAEALKETLEVESFDTIIVANGWNFADALTGSYLATVKNAPILLHDDKNLDANVSYITENLTENGTVYILGGINSVSASLEDALEDQNITVKRLAGDDRFETNLAILKEAGVKNEEILVCTAYNFADSLSASATGLPMLLVDKALTENQIKFLDDLDGNAITVIGGVNSVSEDIETTLGKYSDNVTRIAGETREETSIEVAAKYFEDPTFMVLAYSRNYPDGLCGGPLAYALNAPLVLTNAGAEAVAVEYAAANEISSGLILGGVNSVSDETAKKVFNLTGEGVIPAL